MRVYFDNAATTALDKDVLAEMMPYLTEKFGNPSSIHGFGRETKAAVEKARKTIADLLTASTAEIFFTSGGTESANTIFSCLIGGGRIKEVITSKIEHHCNLHPLQAYEKKGLVKLHYVELDGKGCVNYNHLEELLKATEGETLVALMHANNEIGNLLDINKVGDLCEEYKALFFCDTVQTVAHYPIDVQKLKAHFITAAGHKFHGPKGVGILYIDSDVKIHPFIQGGAQERNMRAGTENIYGIVGMAAAMKMAYDNLDADRQHIDGLKNYMWEQLETNIKGIERNGDADNSLFTVLNVCFPPHEKSSFLLFNLDINGVAVSAGSACSSGSDAGSHVLTELNIDPSRTSIRFSFCKHNTKKEVDFVIGKLVELFAK